MAIYNEQVGVDPVTLLDVPAGKQYAILTVLVCNTAIPDPLQPEANITNFDMYLVPANGGTKGPSTLVLNTVELPAGETFTFDSEKVILEAGDRLIVQGESPTILTATVSYLEV